MAYVYEVSFDISSKQMDLLKIGSSLERVLGYLRTTLPGEIGYVTSRALYSLENDDETHVIFQSEWISWEDLDRHIKSTLLENKVITEFAPHIQLKHLKTQAYNEIA